MNKLLIAVIALFLSVASVRAGTPSSSTPPFTGGTVPNPITAPSFTGAVNTTQSLVYNGALCDVRVFHDSPSAPHVYATVSSGSPNVTFVGTSFTSGDAGKLIVLSGAGTGGLPLAASILSVASGTQITLNANAVTALSTTPVVVYYGHSDATAINNAISALPNGGTIPVPNGICGTSSTIALPALAGITAQFAANIVFQGQGSGVSGFVALGSGLSAVFQEPTAFHKDAAWQNIFVDGAGLSAYALDVRGGFGGRIYPDTVFENGSTGDIRVGDGVSNEIEFVAVGTKLVNDLTIFPGSPAQPLYNLLTNGTDNQFVAVTAANASSSNFRDLGSNNLYTNTHGYGPANYPYWFNANTSCNQCEVDGAGIAGARFDSTGNSWIGGKMFFNGGSTGSLFAFLLSSSNAFTIIDNPEIFNLFEYQYLSVSSGILTNTSINIPGLSKSFSTPNTLKASTTDGSTVVTMTYSGAAPTQFNLPNILSFDAQGYTGIIIARDGTTGAVGAWIATFVISRGNGAATTAIVGSSVTAISGSSVAFTTPPTIGVDTTNGALQINVVGIASNNIAWRYAFVATGTF